MRARQAGGGAGEAGKVGHRLGAIDQVAVLEIPAGLRAQHRALGIRALAEADALEGIVHAGSAIGAAEVQPGIWSGPVGRLRPC
jgi:hypothetical protein